MHFLLKTHTEGCVQTSPNWNVPSPQLPTRFR